jgi:hypothetical protein
MDADKLLKQGMEMAEKLRDTAGEQAERHEDQIKDALGKVTGFVNEKTGGKYTDQVSKAMNFLERGVEMLVAQSPRSETSEPGASGSGASGPGASGSDASSSGSSGTAAGSSGTAAGSSGPAAGSSGPAAGSSGPAPAPGGTTPPPAARPDEPSAG